MANGEAQKAGESGTFSVPGVRRVQFYLIYDEVSIDATSGSVKVFADISGKAAHQTNMAQGSMLPFREEYDAFALSLVPRFGTPAADLNLFFNLAAFEFSINEKPVLKAPTCLFTAGCGLEGVAGYADNSAAPVIQLGMYHNGVASPSAILRFPEPFHIGKGETFNAKIIKDAGLSGLSGAFYCKAVMHGIIRTLIQ